MFTSEFALRMGGPRVTANSLRSPGMCNTKMVRSTFLVAPHSVRYGANNIIRLVLAPDLAATTGRYFEGPSLTTRTPSPPTPRRAVGSGISPSPIPVSTRATRASPPPSAAISPSHRERPRDGEATAAEPASQSALTSSDKLSRWQQSVRAQHTSL